MATYANLLSICKNYDYDRSRVRLYYKNMKEKGCVQFGLRFSSSVNVVLLRNEAVLQRILTARYESCLESVQNLRVKWTMEGVTISGVRHKFCTGNYSPIEISRAKKWDPKLIKGFENRPSNLVLIYRTIETMLLNKLIHRNLTKVLQCYFDYCI